MIFNYLLFLCIGTYVSCVPVEKILIDQAIACTDFFLSKIKDNVPKTLVTVPETLTDDCAKYNLNIYAKSWKKMNYLLAEPSCKTIISDLNKKWIEPEKPDQNCETDQKSFKLLLENLLAQLKEWKNEV